MMRLSIYGPLLCTEIWLYVTEISSALILFQSLDCALKNFSDTEKSYEKIMSLSRMPAFIIFLEASDQRLCQNVLKKKQM